MSVTHNHSWLIPDDIWVLVAQCGGIYASESMRGVCRTWNSILRVIPRPTLKELLLPPVQSLLSNFRNTPVGRRFLTESMQVHNEMCKSRGQVSHLSTQHLLTCNEIHTSAKAEIEDAFRDRMCRVGTQADICVVLALSSARVQELNPRRRNGHMNNFKLFDTNDAIRRSIRHAGGVWALLARRFRRTKYQRIQNVKITRNAQQEDSFKRLATFLKCESGFSLKQQQSMLKIGSMIA